MANQPCPESERRTLLSVTLFVLESAATVTRFVSAGLPCRSLPLFGFRRNDLHDSHGFLCVCKERLLVGAELVEPRLSIAPKMKRFFGHSPLHVKRNSHFRQYCGRPSHFVLAKLPLLIGAHQVE